MKETWNLLKNGNFTRMMLAVFTSELGSYIGVTAFFFYLLKEFTTKPYLGTLSELMMTLPVLFVFFLIGVVADRYDRQKILCYSDIICFILTLLLLVGMMLESIALMFVLLFLRRAVASFFLPAESGIIQGILSKDQYVKSSGINQILLSCLSLFGRGIGIFVFWTLGIEGAIIIDACSFFISFLLIRSCHIPEEVRLPNGKHRIKDMKLKVIFSDYGKGIRYILEKPLLKVLVSGYFVLGIFNALYVLIPIYLLQYKLAPENYEAMAVWEGLAIGGGVLLGSMLLTANSSKIRPITMIITGLLLNGTFSLFIPFISSVWVFLVLLFIVASTVPLISMGNGGILPMIVDSSYMGRVRGCIQPLSMISGSITLIVLSVVFPTFISIDSLYWFIGAIMIATGVAYAIILPKYSGQVNTEERTEKVA